MKKNYPEWINQYARSAHQAFSHMVPSRWSSLDGFSVFRSLNGTFIDHIYNLLSALKKSGVSDRQMWNMFSNPSSLRCAITFLIVEYQFITDKRRFRDKTQFVFSALNSILAAGMLEDAWVENKNCVHTQAEINIIIKNSLWHGSKMAKDAARLYMSLASMGFSLYRDFFPQESHEIFGVYDASSFQKDSKMIIKYFPRLRPLEIWSETDSFPWSEFKIYHITNDIGFRCELIGMHSIYGKAVLPNTLAIAVEADGKFLNSEEIKEASERIARFATDYSSLSERLSIDEFKLKFLDWECHQFIELFRAAKMDWRPSKEMKRAVLDANIPMGLAIDSFPEFAEYEKSQEYEVYWLKELYSNLN
ncbi:MAG: hypothetical protein AAB610_00745 [Patescibacteria group bacterium]